MDFKAGVIISYSENFVQYLEACIKEGLRKFPSVPIFGRELDSDCPFDIDGQQGVLPKGSLVVLPDYYLHRDPRHWKDPEEFRPEVW